MTGIKIRTAPRYVAGSLLLFILLIASAAYSSPGGLDTFIKVKQVDDRVYLGIASVDCSHISGIPVGGGGICNLASMFSNATNFSIVYVQNWVNMNFYNKTEVDAKATALAALTNETAYNLTVLVNLTAETLANQTLTIADQLNATYGGMWNYTNLGYTFPIAAQNVYYNVTGLSSGQLNKFTFTSGSAASGGSVLTVSRSGVYQITAMLSAAGAQASIYGFAVVRNGMNPVNSTDNPNCYSRFTGSGFTQTQTASIACYKRLYSGDRLSAIIADEKAPTNDLDIYNMNVNVIWVGN